MEIKRLIRLNGAMLVVLLSMCCANVAHADLTIKVQKGGEAPYLYAYDNGGTALLGTFPGTQFTEKDEENYWTMRVADNNGVNIVFSNGNSGSGNQTNDIKRIPGVNGVAKFMYDGKSNWFSMMPQLSQTEGYIYFNCPPDWGNSSNNPPYIHFLNSNDGQLGAQGWPGYQMEYAGLDGAGFEIYKYYTANWNGIAKLVFNCGSNSHQTSNLIYVENGDYNTE